MQKQSSPNSNTTIVSINHGEQEMAVSGRANSNTTIVSINHNHEHKNEKPLAFKYNYCFY